MGVIYTKVLFVCMSYTAHIGKHYNFYSTPKFILLPLYYSFSTTIVGKPKEFTVRFANCLPLVLLFTSLPPCAVHISVLHYALSYKPYETIPGVCHRVVSFGSHMGTISPSLYFLVQCLCCDVVSMALNQPVY